MKRREFLHDFSLALATTASAPLLSQCNFGTEQVNGLEGQPPMAQEIAPRYLHQRADIQLTGNEEKLAETLKAQYERLKTLALSPGEQLRIACPTRSGTEILALSIVAGGAASYRHVRLVKEPTGEVVNLLWGREGTHPSIKLTDDQGKTLVRDGRQMEFSFGLVRRNGTGPRSWLELGIKIAAIALLVWLGASILKPILAAIAFVAFNAMVIAIVIAGVAIFVLIVRWLLVLTGWTIEDVRTLSAKTPDEFARFQREVASAL